MSTAKEQFLTEVEQRLQRMFSCAKEGYKPSPVERHRLEGFMQAGVFIGLADNLTLSTLMSEVHQRVFGRTIEEREQEAQLKWQEYSVDYSQYDTPAFIRQNS